MKKIIKNIALFLCISIVYSSCTSIDFGDTNENPNGPTAAVTSQLLTFAQSYVPGIVTNITGILYTQQLTEGQYPGESKYSTLTYSYNGYYTGPVQNLNRIIQLNQDEATKSVAALYGDNNNQIGVAKSLRAYFLAFMTDRWGALPWTEAFQGIDFPQPKFDTQEEIYNYMFAELDEAISLMNTSNSGPAGDVVFGGNMTQWISFANSLKLTLALRISDANPSLAKSKFEAAVASGALIMSNSDNLEFNYGSDDANDSPWNDRFKTREDYILSETLVEALRSNLDPRLFKFGEPARDGSASNPMFPGGIDAKYVGAENGKVNGNVPDYSFPSAAVIYDPVYPSLIYSSAQTKFALAEAKLKGWNVGSASAASLFKQAIEDSMEYWGVSTADTNAYTAAHTSVTINDIAYEKWVALYLNGPEAWAEWRRLDAPALTPSIYASDARIPVRHAYDSSVEDNNKTNYDAINASQGPDNLHTKLWWDKN